MKILYFVAEDYYFVSHRFNLARAAQKAGYDIAVLTCVTQYKTWIEDQGFELYPLQIDRSTTSLCQNLRLLYKIFKNIRTIKPDLVHNIAVKPIVLGTLAAWIASPRIQILNAFAGLGYIFTSNDLRAKRLKKLLIGIYRLLFRSRRVSLLFQNKDDARLFGQSILKSPNRIHVIPGSGVDIAYYQPQLAPTGASDRYLNILMAARLLKDKGIYEYIEAIRLLKKSHPNLKFYLAGALDPKNPSCISHNELKTWIRANLVTYWGEVSDIRRAFSKADVVILPSYREGLPKVLLEASACSKAIITTDVPGCRELIQHNLNGILIPKQSALALSKAILDLKTAPGIRARLGQTAREHVEKYFSDTCISTQTLALYRQLLEIAPIIRRL